MSLDTQWRWNVWSAIEKLEGVQGEFYPKLTPKVVEVMRQWAKKWVGDPEWRSILNKAALHKEMEESIVAIHHLLEAIEKEEKVIVMDICAGKGLFSFLLSYLKPPNVEKIVMLEKAAINWYHITHGANPRAEEEGRPLIEIWGNTNLHDYDVVLDRIQALKLPVAMTGIHLCKQLGPSFIGLVNGLGKERCVYACLAPCCMPRAVTAQKNKERAKQKSFLLEVQRYETINERDARKDYTERRGRLKKKPRTGPCFLCQDERHNLIDCPVLPTLPPAEQTKIRRNFHSATIPCWNCLALGHYKADCPQAIIRSNPLSVKAPVTQLDVSRVLGSKKPYNTYCHVLAETFEERTFKVIETELENSENHQDGNWNSERKSIFIVAK